MPELPEVETIRRGLESNILHKRITNVVVNLPKIVRGDTGYFQQTLQGDSFEKIKRRGKLLFFTLQKSDDTLLLHLKMTGQLIYPQPDSDELASISKEPSSKKKLMPAAKGGQTNKKRISGGHPFPDFNTQLPNKYTHVMFEFEDKSTLYFNDMRQFGYLELSSPDKVSAIEKRYGLEPLDPQFTLDSWKKLIVARRTKLKSFLLNQKYVAGLGNIYADEVAWFAKAHPETPLNELGEQQVEDLYQGIKTILSEAVKFRGTTFKDYADEQGKSGGYASKLKVFGREGEPCPRCHTPIEKIRVAGRGTHYCPQCQIKN